MTLTRLLRDTFAALGQAWSQLWFEDSPTTPLEITRIGVGAAMLLHYTLAIPHLFEMWGNDGWSPREVALSIREPWMQSIFFYFDAPWQLAAFHGLFLLCCAALMVGWRTSWVKWVLLVGHISYVYRNLTLVYGVDWIVSSLLFIMCIAPVGRAMSLDRVRAVRKAKLGNLEAVLPPYHSPWAGACIRLMQIQMAVIFFYSAVSKLHADIWLNGDAVWIMFTSDDYYHSTMVSLLASHYWIGNLATYGTVLVEIAFPFLIWQPSTRPYLLAAAIILHLLFAFLMGLFYFSIVMIMGHVSFVRPEWLAQLGAAWKRTIGEMEMIYDGRCGFCVRSMAWFLAFDGLSQIKVRNFRDDPSPAVSDAQMEKALYLVLPDGRALPGFEAYRYVVPRVPGLWWQIPLFYVPVVSRLIGHPVYNWIASHRSLLSAMLNRPVTGIIKQQER
ncbi:Predicted thiol-disulfide oxidoreductase YuxK, DCC family [Bradyrhizobium erythrophlei]|uniref:Predicted thiol-disulfide oxidoreductase YuxK, DCC family n=2 Tax=Bradyrhizobium erythrophlei TaxID=1437360 RepID=A0A1M7U807_9BRAD|nr:Predicted thiol-disulfide oxidoreductase YuxK, DCC family [Bradyrhizobium erythrophlei]